jgi:glucose-1-phosphate thymidylyltransferase
MPNHHTRQNSHRDLIGIVPAAGTASRLGQLPCSKELLTVGFEKDHTNKHLRLKVVSNCLLECMQHAKVSKAYIILRKGKWDIPAYFGDGKLTGIPLAYLMMGLPFGVPYTINQAFPFVKDSMVVFGFPDIIFHPREAFTQLLQKQNESKSDIVLGLFSTHPNHKGDMVTLGPDGKLESIQTNPESLDRGHTWIIAAWTPQFTHFLNDYIASRQSSGHDNQTDASHFTELFMGDVFQVAIENDLSTEVVHFPEGRFLDIGSPENLVKIIRTDLMTCK